MRATWIFLAILLISPHVKAEPLEHFPGWSVDRIAAAAEEGTYERGPEFYSLTPPDGRPAVTIDGRIASGLKRGQGNPEDAYGRKTAAASTKQEEEYVYGASNNGYVIAELPESTAPGAGISPPVPKPQGIVSSPGFSARPAPSSPAASSASSRLPASSPSYRSDPPSQTASAPAGPAYDSASASAGGAPAAASAPLRPIEVAKAEEDLNFSSRESSIAANGIKMAGAAAAEKDAKVAKGSSEGGGTGLVASREPQGLGFETAAEKKKAQQRQAKADKKKAEEYQAKNMPEPCESLNKHYVDPGITRVKVPEGCRLVYVTAWGGGGGNGPQTSGGGGALANGSGKFDAAKYDLLVVVGAAGGETANQRPGLGGFPGGGTGGASSTAPGGGGGGYSGVFKVAKNSAANEILTANALALAGGGGGGSGRGRNGEAGGHAGSGGGEALRGGDGGAGLTHPGCQATYGAPEGQCYISTPSNNSDQGPSQELVARDHGSAGGGGGGGGIQGGGGGVGAAWEAENGNGAYSAGGSSSSAAGGKGGSSVVNMDNNILEGGNGVIPGFQYYPDRGDAGSPGRHGKVILQYY
jgi:hypothetical protein